MEKRLVATAAVLVVGLGMAGCSSSSSTSSSTTTTAAPSSTTAAPSSTTAVATTGGASPQAVADAFVTAIQNGDLPTFCTYALPSQASQCAKDIKEAAGVQTYKDIAVGTVTTQGDRALVALTGSICPTSTTQSTGSSESQTDQCISNSDPNVATKSHKTFAAAYAAATSSNSQSGSPFVTVMVRKNGRWYAVGF
jgi:hypothetical protein